MIKRFESILTTAYEAFDNLEQGDAKADFLRILGPRIWPGLIVTTVLRICSNWFTFIF